MLIAEARVQTERSSRYLVQLCRHVNEVAEATPHMGARVEWSEDRGMISFDWGGRCTLRAEQGVLTLRAEAPDQKSLRRVEQQVADRLERFGRRDHLTVAWTPPWDGGEQPPSRPRPTREDAHMVAPPRYPDTDEDTGVGPDRRSTTGTQSWRVKVALIIAAALFLAVVVLHLIGGGFSGLH